MSNSSLVTYTLISPNKSHPRLKSIDTITIHCFVGQVTAKRGCEVFQNTSKQASSNYVVGYDGSIGMCVDEADRAWTTGGSYTVNGETGSMNDQHAVTIEVACDSFAPYAVTDAAYDALIKLVADIAKRNNLGELKWRADKSLVGKPQEQNMTVHRWFAAKACPGDYLYERMGDIANKANEILGTEIVVTDVDYNVEVITKSGLNCRTEHSLYSSIVKTYPVGTVLHISKESEGWGYTGEGWISLDSSYSQKINKEEIDMTKDEVQNMIDNAVNNIKPTVYKTLADVPDWALPTIETLVKNGKLMGDGNGNLNLTEDLTRALVIMSR